MRGLRAKQFGKLGLVSVLGLAGLAAMLVVVACSRGQPESKRGGLAEEEPSASDRATAVRVIHPKRDPSFAISVRAPAQVQAYEWADLEAQVAGRVEYIRKAEGAPVRAGELLIRISVPDLDQAMLEKESVIHQRQAEQKLAEADERVAEAARTVAAKNLEIAQSAIQAAQSMEDYRGKEFQRFSSLVAQGAATRSLVDEQELAYKAAMAETAKARAGMLKAEADLEQAQAKLETAKADVLLKGEMVDVARKDRDRARALADYAKVTAPFDGVITRRNINPGSFVQNATTAHTAPLVRVERQDIVTVSMKVPDTFAPYVDRDTEAVIEMSELPGQTIHGKVTRFSPTLESEARDHTMVVEVDLFNGRKADYQAFLARERAKKEPFADLKDGPLPLPLDIEAKGSEPLVRLYPGMYGDMKLVFRHLQNAYLLPSDAIVRQGGTPFVYLVRNGKAMLTPVEVQVDDQRLARVALLEKTSNGTVKRELTGAEEVVYSNQSDLTDGQAVTAIAQDWRGQD